MSPKIHLPHYPLRNNQPVEKPVDKCDVGNFLDVQSLFATIQGEGPFVGTPSIFVRMAGCNLQCPACFSASTVIRMADFSTKLIPEISVGDRVLSYSRKKERFVKKKVVAVMQHQVTSVYRVQTESNKKTFVTADHPFLVREKGWVLAKNLQVGDKIIHLSLSELRRLHNPMSNPESVEKMLQSKIETYGSAGGPGMSEEARDIVSAAARERMIENNPMKDPTIAVRGYLSRIDRGKQTGPEKFVAKVGRKFNLVFTGGGDLVVGNKIPDFRIADTNKLIEVWDITQTEFMGRNEEWMRQRRAIYEAEGYEVLFLPVFPYPLGDEVGTKKPERLEARNKEVSRIRRAIAEFARNGETVRSVTELKMDRDHKAWVALTGRKDAKLTVYNFEVEGTHTYVADGMVVHNCDTDYMTGRTPVAVEALVDRVINLPWPGGVKLWRGTDLPLVVITGGEPLRQPIGDFVRKLLENRFTVQIETNGTLYREDFPYASPDVTIVCSPKTGSVQSSLKPWIRAWKYVVSVGEGVEDDGLPSAVLGNRIRPARPSSAAGVVYVQPADEGDEELNKANLQLAIRSCMENGYRLCLQTHKLCGLP